jgi:hypothetical protein
MTTPLPPDPSGDAPRSESQTMSLASIETFLAQQSSPHIYASVREGQTIPLWKRALDQHAVSQRASHWDWQVPSTWVKVGSVAALLLLTMFIMLPALGKSRASSRAWREASSTGAMPPVTAAPNISGSGGSTSSASSAPSTGGQPLQSSSSDRGPNGGPDRVIIRKDTVDIEASNVGSAFAKARMLVNEATGEYIEDARQTGKAPYDTAQITLRINALRVGEVLVQLGTLGTIVQQTTSGTDVTDQVVDLDARLRNERRIEMELLELMTARPDAPLKDVLEVRESLARVRTEIERMVGQQQRLSRLASLATIVVSLSQEHKTPAPVQAGIFADLQREAADAWRSGLRGLTATLGLIIAVAVGGAVFWVALGVIVAAVVLTNRAKARAAAHERAPVY